MTGAAGADARAEVLALRRQAVDQRERAARSASAARHEAQERAGPESLRPLHVRMKELHRRVEARHLAVATLSELYASRIERWLDDVGAGIMRPVFMAAVAAALGTSGAIATLRGRRHAAELVAASDAKARAAHELEYVLAEGPATEAATRETSIAVAGAALLERWPQYGPAVAELGVRAVTAASLGPPGASLGVLCTYAAEPVLAAAAAVAATDRMAGALAQMVLLDDILPGPPVFHEDALRVAVHQAAGMVSVHCGCDVDAAEDLLAARAFAAGLPVEEIAAQVLRGETHLC